MKILIAEDDPVCRQILSDHLDDLGHEVTAVADGQAAWDILKARHTMDMVILDWMMPLLDGYEVCQNVRNEGWRSDVYILVISGSQRKADIVRILVAGADDCLLKPFDSIDLLIRLRLAKRVIDLQDEALHRPGEVSVASGGS